MHAFLQRLSCGFIVLASFGVSTLAQAQFISTTTGTGSYTSTYDFEFRSDATLIAKGAFGTGSLLSGDQGAGTRLLWFPSLAAFRAGRADGSQWDAGYIGAYSAAFNCDTTASGTYSVAFGQNTFATNAYSAAFGNSTTASGASSTAFGVATTASGQYSTSFGNLSVASGLYATAFGTTTAGYYASTTFGFYNTTPSGSATAWVATDPLLQVGNGTSTTPSDALIIYKNGSAAFQGIVTVGAGGDVPMYNGN